MLTELAVQPLEARKRNFRSSVEQLEKRIEQLAVQNLQEAIKSGAYTAPEIKAMICFEQLRLAGDIDLVSLYIKGRIIKEIEEHGLYSVHPGGYKDMFEALLSEANLSRSEVSNIKNLYEIIFPALEKMGYDPIALWNYKSNLREAVPYLLGAIIGNSQSSNVQKFLEERADKTGEEIVEEIVHQIENSTNKTLRDFFRPKERIPAMLFHVNGHSLLVAEFDPDNDLRVLNSNLFEIKEGYQDDLEILRRRLCSTTRG